MPQTSSIPLAAASQSPARVIRVWDLPLRLFHWLLAGLVVTAGVTGKIGGNAMEIHLWAGYGIANLVVFRFLWGWVGTPHARFASFVRGLPTTFAYCRQLLGGTAPVRPGHNPLGAWMVLLLLAALAFQAGSGLFANDDIMTEGPLFDLVSKDTSDYLTALHKLGFKALLVLAGVHVTAIALYLGVKRINLIGPMVTGRMAVTDPSLPEPAMTWATNLLALALLAASAAGFWFLVL